MPPNGALTDIAPKIYTIMLTEVFSLSKSGSPVTTPRRLNVTQPFRTLPTDASTIENCLYRRPQVSPEREFCRNRTTRPPSKKTTRHTAILGAIIISKEANVRKYLKTRPRCPCCDDLTYVRLSDEASFGKNICKNCMWESKAIIKRPADAEISELKLACNNTCAEDAFVLLCIEKMYRPFASDEEWVLACCENLLQAGHLKKIPGELQDLYVLNEGSSKFW